MTSISIDLLQQSNTEKEDFLTSKWAAVFWESVVPVRFFCYGLGNQGAFPKKAPMSLQTLYPRSLCISHSSPPGNPP